MGTAGRMVGLALAGVITFKVMKRTKVMKKLRKELKKWK